MKSKFNLKPLSVVCLSLLLSACGGGGGGGGGDSSTPPPLPSQNQAPLANAGNTQTVDEQTQVTLQGTGTDSDGTISSFSWSQTSGTTVTLNNATSATATFTAPALPQNETLVFSLTVTDNQGATASDSISITVNYLNLPAAIAISGPEQADEQSTVTLISELVSNDIITGYKWQQTAGPVIEFSEDEQAQFQFKTPIILMTEGPQQITIQLSITTLDNQTTQAQLTTEVKPVNEPPKVQFQQAQIHEGSTSLLSLLVSDTDGSITNTQWTQLTGPTVAVLNSDIDSISFIAPTVIEHTPVSFKATVWDNEQQSTQIEFTNAIDNKLQFDTGPKTLLDSNAISLKPYYPVYADWDNDGDQDVIVIQQLQGQSGQIYYYRNKGDGTFITPPVKLANLKGSLQYDRPGVLAKLDLNNDNVPELLIGSYYGGALGWLDITQPSSEIVWIDQTQRAVLDIDVADINNDGLMDVYLNANGSIYWYANKGNAQFDSPVLLTTVPANAIGVKQTKMLFGDIDHDGKQDMIMANREGSLQVSWGQGNGVFDQPTAIAAVSAPSAVFAEDLNNDGRVDLLFTDNGFIDFDTSGIRYFLNQNNRSFSAHQDDSRDFVAAATMVDLDGDGNKALIISNRTGRIHPDGVWRSGHEVVRYNHFATAAQSKEVIYFEDGGFVVDDVQAIQLDLDAPLELTYAARYRDTFFYLDQQSQKSDWAKKSMTRVKTETGFARQSMIVIADLDQDGQEDMIAAGDSRLAVYKGPVSTNQDITTLVESDGVNLAEPTDNTPDFKQIAAIDWDSDGKLDLIATSLDRAYLYRQTENMAFAKGELLYTTSPTTLAFIDQLIPFDNHQFVLASRQFDFSNNQAS
ncbi:MAG: VCBS repeat-containing protein, partial [Psychrosphaera sp.]|nr:VCBS repeat-containing protein [Psychrosphaera sp.]